jgi:hypothetical protein
MGMIERRAEFSKPSKILEKADEKAADTKNRSQTNSLN